VKENKIIEINSLEVETDMDNFTMKHTVLNVLRHKKYEGSCCRENKL
jgi:hypothetical protein